MTGGAGFIGSHLVDALLARGCRVRVLDTCVHGNKLGREALRRVEMVHGSVCDRALLMEAAHGVDTIFHLAAVLGVDMVCRSPDHAMRTELAGGQHVADAAVAQRARVLFASTSSVYGTTEKPAEESHALSMRSGYAVAKRCVESYLEACHQTTGLESVSVRYFNVYGPRQDERMVVPRFLRQALRGDPLRIFGDGTQTRDFTFVRDAVEASVRLAERLRGCAVVNVATGLETSILELAERAGDLAACDVELRFERPPVGREAYEVARRFGSTAQLERLVGFVPRTAFEQGLAETFESLLADPGPPAPRAAA